MALPAGSRIAGNIRAGRAQARLEAEFVERSSGPVAAEADLPARPMLVPSPIPTPEPKPPRIGEPVARITIPAIGLRMVVVEGTAEAQLEEGPGRYRESAMPCTGGNVAIAGHRTTYLHPFNRLDELRPGDRILLETRGGDCRYEVVRAWQVVPTNIRPVSPTDFAALTLTTCAPEGYATYRLIVRARLT